MIILSINLNDVIIYLMGILAPSFSLVNLKILDYRTLWVT
jgi:hypothetical protein